MMTEVDVVSYSRVVLPPPINAPELDSSDIAVPELAAVFPAPEVRVWALSGVVDDESEIDTSGDWLLGPIELIEP